MKLSLTQKKALIPLVLVLVNFIYLYIGGLIFSAIEYKPRNFPKTADHVSELLETLKQTAAGKSILPEKLNTKEVVKQLSAKNEEEFDKTFQKYDDERAVASRLDWSFSNSFFFASTVITTIGYGNIAPVTAGGRTVCVLYALIGIPLTLMLLATVGNIINKYLNDACAWLVTKFKKYSSLECEETGNIETPVWIALPIMFVFLALMSSIYCALESWDFGTSLYFIVITFTTIGFGDVVPHSRAGIWVNTTLLYVGLSLVSITINLVATGASRQMEKTGKYLKILQIFTAEKEKKEDPSQTSTTTAQTEEEELSHHGNPFSVTQASDRRLSRERQKAEERVEMEVVSEVEQGMLGRAAKSETDDKSAVKERLACDVDEKHYGTMHE